MANDGSEGYRTDADDYDVIIYTWKHCQIAINY